jgi:hypothetical protein
VPETMAQPREPHPIVRTYLSTSTSKKGKTKIHARVYAPELDLDRRGTGPSPTTAVARALKNIVRRQ